MEVQKDFKELLELFNNNKVKYIIVGAYALAYHGVPRYTGAMDIFVKSDTGNALKIIKAMDAFGFGSLGLKKHDFEEPEKVIQFGYPPVRVDIVTSIPGVTWDEAFQKCDKGKYADVPVYYIGREQLIKNKMAIGREKDLADLEALGIE